MNNIIISADDCGISENIDKGIFDCLDNGLISDFSLMSNGENFENTIKKINDREIKNVGCHVCLVDNEKMIAEDPKNILGKNNKFYKSSTPYNLFLSSYFKKEILEQCRKEINLQVTKIYDYNLKISHLDSHQHTHLFPNLSEIFIDICNQYKIKFLRNPVAIKKNFRSYIFRIFSNIFKRKINNKNFNIVSAYGFDMSNGLEFEYIKKIIDKNFEINTTTELFCHPGYIDEIEKLKFSHWNFKNWEEDIKILNKISNYLKSKNKKIINYNELSKL